MPNWCFTSYYVEGEKEEIDALYEIMNELKCMDKPLVQNGFGTGWLGNLITALKGDCNKIGCRGHWFNTQMCEDALYFDVESAWCEPYETIAFLSKKFPTLTFYYQADEPGCKYYVTNDKDGIYFKDIYYVGDAEDSNYYAEQQQGEFLQQVGCLIKRELKSIDEVYDAVDQYNEDKEWEGYIEVKIYKVVS